jgi:hypothetical protein
MLSRFRFLRYIFVILAGVILLWLVMDLNSRMTVLKRLSIEQGYVQQDADDIIRTKAVLQTEEAYAKSDAAAEAWAREQGMVRSGDVPVIPLQSTPIELSPTPKPTVVVTETEKWQAWYLLFFGPRAP